MNEDSRDDWTLLGLTAIAVLAALGAALAWRASPARDTVVEEALLPSASQEAEWIATETPGEEMLVRHRSEMQRLARSAAQRRAEEAELDALVKRSEDALERVRQAATKLEASLRSVRPAYDGMVETTAAPPGR